MAYTQETLIRNKTDKIIKGKLFFRNSLKIRYKPNKISVELINPEIKKVWKFNPKTEVKNALNWYPKGGYTLNMSL